MEKDFLTPLVPEAEDRYSEIGFQEFVWNYKLWELTRNRDENYAEYQILVKRGDRS